MATSNRVFEEVPIRARTARIPRVVLATVTVAFVAPLIGFSPAAAAETAPPPAASGVSNEPTPAPDDPVAPAPTTAPSTETAPPSDPASPAPTTPPAPSTAPPSSPPASPLPTPAPTPSPTPEPTTPPPGTSTPPLTEPPPTEPSAPPPTPTPTPAPAPPTLIPSATPAPTAPLPGLEANDHPVLLVGSGPYLRIEPATDPRASRLIGARSTLNDARAALRSAQSELASARALQANARALAEQLDEQAADAEAEAAAAARLHATAARSDDAVGNSVGAVFGAGNNLLAGLSRMQQLATLVEHADETLEIADRTSQAAHAADLRAEEAWTAVGQVPVDDYEHTLASAEAAVGEARSTTASLESELTSEQITVVAALPLDSGQLSDQGWSAPVGGHVTDGFGPRPDKPMAGVNEFHRGTDVAASCGSPVFAATSGVVVDAGANGSYGNWILINHGTGVSTGYAHLQNGGILVEPGTVIDAGALIGMVGSTGASTGCHLHFEVRIDDVAVDALPFLATRGIGG